MPKEVYIIIITYELKVDFMVRKELWSDLKTMCQDHRGFDYVLLLTKSFPFDYQGWLFEKLRLNKPSKYDTTPPLLLES